MGHHNIRFDGDANALNGIWSPPTSRANFCEEDYAISFWIAEFMNSLTNVAYVYLALRHIYRPGSRGSSAPRLDFMSISLLILGIGSFLFHASMRLTFEFIDELSMMTLTWSMMQSLYTTRQTRKAATINSIILAIVHVGFAVFYVWTAKIIYQVIAFFAAIGAITLRFLYLFHWSEPALPKDKVRNWQVRTWKAVGISLFGYLVWNIDLEYCTELRAFKESIGLPWSWLFELHGWWHILTAIGASMFINVVREVREETEHEKKA